MMDDDNSDDSDFIWSSWLGFTWLIIKVLV